MGLVIKVFLSMEETNLQQNITTHCGGGYRQLLKGGDAGREGEYISVELCAEIKNRLLVENIIKLQVNSTDFKPIIGPF